MDQIALFADIHGNLPALETVLADIRGRGIDTIYCLGDLVGKGPDSCEVVDICRECCQAVVKGNWDEDTVTLDLTAEPTGPWSNRTNHLAWQRQRLGPARLAYLAGLPNVIDFTMSGKRVRLFHASQRSVHYRVLHRDEPVRQRALFENTPFTAFDNPAPDVVGYGDIHHAFLLPIDGKLLFNVGSVGNPMDFLPLAGYVVLHGRLEKNPPAPLSIEIVRLPYDIDGALARAIDAGMPDYAEYEFELRTANHRSQMRPSADGVPAGLARDA